jgi:hypothetical protein
MRKAEQAIVVLARNQDLGMVFVDHGSPQCALRGCDYSLPPSDFWMFLETSLLGSPLTGQEFLPTGQGLVARKVAVDNALRAGEKTPIHRAHIGEGFPPVKVVPIPRPGEFFRVQVL